MPERGVVRGTSGVKYDRDVFINCPFDVVYEPNFHAISFTILSCGFTPRSALEIIDGGTTRIDIIVRLIEECRIGIHDLSRVELNTEGLPRFNMPFELGLFVGAQRLGKGRQRQKKCLILDSEPFRYQKFISDIAGQDIAAHGNDLGRAIARVREFLTNFIPENEALPPGGVHIAEDFADFQSALPELCSPARIQPDELQFVERTRLAREWLIRRVGRT